MPIGAGEERDGIYYFRHLPKPSNFACSVQHSDLGALWHKRLGHPSKYVINKSLGQTINLDFLDNCTICLRAKQTRELFPVSLNNATALFDFVHCDLWGPYRIPSSCGASYFLTVVDDYSRCVWISCLKK